MTDTPSSDDQEGEGVLRPFVERPHEPLPPVLAAEPAEPPEPASIPAPPVAPPAPPADESTMFYPPDTSGKIVLSRKLFGIGLLVVALAIGGLAFLWSTASDDGESAVDDPTSTTVDASGDPAPTATDSSEGDEGSGDTIPDDGDAALIDDLRAEIGELQSEIAANPVPALPGSSMQRIVVTAGSSFVSASETSVAVVGPFGNYANIDPLTNAVTAAGQVADGATRVIRTPTSVWLTNYHDSQLVWVDPVTNTVRQTFDFPGPDGLAKDGGSLIVSSFDDGFVARFDPGVGQAIERVDVGGSPTAVAVDGQGSIWVAVFDTGELVRIDPVDFTITDRIPVGAGPVGLAISDGTIWVANNQESTVVAVSMAERKVLSSHQVGVGPTELLVVGDSVWVAVTDAGELVQISIPESRIVTRTPLGGVARNGGPTGISFGAGSIWVAVEGEQSVVRITVPA